jgi:5'(3')-deoxyribonucleotidase
MGTILLDVDGVLADFTGMVRRIVASIGATMPDPVTEWGFIKALPRDVRYAVEDALEGDGPWTDMEPIPGALDAVKAFRSAGHRVVFVTSPWASCTDWAYVRTGWLRRNMGAGMQDVVITSAKELVRGDVFVDDKPENVGAWGQVNAYNAFIWDAPYNQGHPVIPRLCGGWMQGNVNRVLEAAAR